MSSLEQEREKERNNASAADRGLEVSEGSDAGESDNGGPLPPSDGIDGTAGGNTDGDEQRINNNNTEENATGDENENNNDNNTQAQQGEKEAPVDAAAEEEDAGRSADKVRGDTPDAADETPARKDGETEDEGVSGKPNDAPSDAVVVPSAQSTTAAESNGQRPEPKDDDVTRSSSSSSSSSSSKEPLENGKSATDGGATVGDGASEIIVNQTTGAGDPAGAGIESGENGENGEAAAGDGTENGAETTAGEKAASGGGAPEKAETSADPNRDGIDSSSARGEDVDDGDNNLDENDNDESKLEDGDDRGDGKADQEASSSAPNAEQGEAKSMSPHGSVSGEAQDQGQDDDADADQDPKEAEETTATENGKEGEVEKSEEQEGGGKGDETAQPAPGQEQENGGSNPSASPTKSPAAGRADNEAGETATLEDFETAVPSLASLGLPDRSFLRAEEVARELQDKGRFHESLGYMAAGLLARRDQFGFTSPEVSKAAEAYVVTANMIAVEHTGIGSDDIAYSTLRGCEAVLTKDSFVHNEPLRLKLLAITYNNLGAYFHHRNKLHAALHYLSSALRLETVLGSSESPACTHLNLCAVLSRLGRHEDAVDHVQCALEHLTATAQQRSSPDHRFATTTRGQQQQQQQQQETHASDSASSLHAASATAQTEGNAERSVKGDDDSSSVADSNANANGDANGGSNGGSNGVVGGGRSSAADALCLLPVALHNLGVEHEFLGRLDAAAEAYLRASIEAEERLGHDHPVAARIRLALAKAESAAARTAREFGARSRQEGR